jgi:hypothetical protein
MGCGGSKKIGDTAVNGSPAKAGSPKAAKPQSGSPKGQKQQKQDNIDHGLLAQLQQQWVDTRLELRLDTDSESSSETSEEPDSWGFTRTDFGEAPLDDDEMSNSYGSSANSSGALQQQIADQKRRAEDLAKHKGVTTKAKAKVGKVDKHWHDLNDTGVGMSPKQPGGYNNFSDSETATSSSVDETSDDDGDDASSSDWSDDSSSSDD